MVWGRILSLFITVLTSSLITWIIHLESLLTSVTALGRKWLKSGARWWKEVSVEDGGKERESINRPHSLSLPYEL